MCDHDWPCAPCVIPIHPTITNRRRDLCSQHCTPFPLHNLSCICVRRIPAFERARMLQLRLDAHGFLFSIVSPNRGSVLFLPFHNNQDSSISAGICKCCWGDRFQTVRYFATFIGFASCQEIRWRMEEWPATW